MKNLKFIIERLKISKDSQIMTPKYIMIFPDSWDESSEIEYFIDDNKGSGLKINNNNYWGIYFIQYEYINKLYEQLKKNIDIDYCKFYKFPVSSNINTFEKWWQSFECENDEKEKIINELSKKYQDWKP